MAIGIPFPHIGMLILGVVLFFIAPKIVGMILRILGIALIIVGGVMYKFPAYNWAASEWYGSAIAILPLVSGIALIAVGEGMAKMAVRIAGILLVLSGLAGLGLI